jgi:hypothetical protein
MFCFVRGEIAGDFLRLEISPLRGRGIKGVD